MPTGKRLTPAELIEALPKDSWLRDWMRIWPTAEPPKSYILFAGLIALGAGLGRQVWYDDDPHVLYPMLNAMFIGPSGIGKSTAIGLGFRLVEALPRAEQPTIIAGASTPQAIHEELVVNNHAIVFASELANFFTKEKFMVGLIPYITELLDYNKFIEKRTLSHGLVKVHEPSVSVVGGSTVDWLQGALPDSAISGGFLARFLLVPEEHKGQKVAIPKLALTDKQRIELEVKRERVFNDFITMMNVHRGEILLADNDAADEYSEWYNSYTPDSGILNPFAARAGEFIKRMSILIALSCGDTVIEARHIASSKQLYEYCAAKLHDVVVPLTAKGKMLAQVLHAIGREPMPLQKLYQAMRNSMSALDVDQCLMSLQQSGDIKRDKEGNVYR